MIEEQLLLFPESVLAITVGTELYIWYKGSDLNGHASLRCRITEVNPSDESMTFFVSNGNWSGELYPTRKMISIGLSDVAQIDKFEFYNVDDRRILLNKLEDDWYDDIPF